MKVNSRLTPRLPIRNTEPAVKTVRLVPAQGLPPRAFSVKDGFDAHPVQGRVAQNKVASSSAHPQAQGVTAGAAASKKGAKVPEAALHKLSAKEQKTVETAALGKPGTPTRDHLDAVMKSKGFQALGAEQQAHVLQSYLAGPPTSASSTRQLTALVNSSSFQGLSAGRQGQTLEVFNATDLGGRKRLVTLVTREVNGKSALLDKDKDKNTLLDNLHAMATDPLAKTFATNGISRASLLSTVMQEAGRPGEINQSDRGTCTVTSMQYMLNRTNPAEYVRIMRGLTSPEGQVKLRGGSTIKRDAGSVALDSATERSTTERLFQSAMMEYGNGKDKYSNLTDKSTKDDKSQYGGLYSEQETKALKGLFGQDFNFHTGGFFDRLFNRVDADDVVDKLSQRNNQQTLVDLTWGNGGHAVVVQKVENGRVYFRNPWGPTTDANGTPYPDPPRRLENGASRLESMSVEDFKKYVRGAYLPN